MVSLSYEYSDDAVMVQKDANGIGKKFSPLIYPAPHCLTVADCNPCGASQIHIGVIKPGSSGRELTQEIMIIVTIVRTVSIAKNSPYRIERYRECYIVFANTISPLFTTLSYPSRQKCLSRQ